MAKVLVKVPDGEMCDNRRFANWGEVVWNLFNEYRKSDEDCHYYKCPQCPRDSNFIIHTT